MFTSLLTLQHPPLVHCVTFLSQVKCIWFHLEYCCSFCPLASSRLELHRCAVTGRSPLICWCWHTSSSFCFRQNKHPPGLICDVILEILFNFVCKQVFQHRGMITCQCPLSFLTKVLRSSLSISKATRYFSDKSFDQFVCL